MKKLLLMICIFLIALCGCGNQPAKNGKVKPIYAMSVEDMFPGDELAQALAEAASDGDIEEIDELVSKGANVNAHHPLGYTPLVWVLQHPNKKGFRRLLELGADPNFQIEGSDFSPLHWAVRKCSPTSSNLSLDYLRMMFEIGNADPNLVGLDRGKLPIEWALLSEQERIFLYLVSAGADVDRIVSGGRSVITRLAEVANYKMVLYWLEKGINYHHVSPPPLDFSVQSVIDLTLESRVVAEDPRIDGYMWLWRVVDWLEKRGMTFEDYPNAKRPAKLDTTPIVFETEASEVRLSHSMFIHEVNLTYPTPVWAQTEETANNIKTRFKQNGGTIIYESLPRKESIKDWTHFYSVMGLYAPGYSFDTIQQAVKAKIIPQCAESSTTQIVEQSDNHKLYLLRCNSSETEGVLFIGKHRNTYVAVYQAWYPLEAGDIKAKVIADMQKIKMEDGYTVKPMPDEIEEKLKQ
ncbi:ankyrin repeat domain-containing protein [Pseudodesulfovibrio sp. zrk46]|uniref:ankyrin repeat domain-containing protein n=1 Tax=Pseudodesulfovibrio sp. zrk46 TaxID=2725288 RepID=UPI001449E5BA|nr:ankyrin repeat domain-containing protein [Pseudodesulfovibrio sp. zrk46]QJB55693.1 hypothetical protein HFN16_04445 [Pseudodesulfovibrio sp. zrk46]